MIGRDFDATDYISSCALKSDDDIKMAELALAMVYDDHENLSIDRYFNHLKKISGEVDRRFRALLEAGSSNDSNTRLAALKHVISDVHDYQPDSQHHEILEGADMVRVIDRGRGCSTALCILYMDAAREQGWQVEGLKMPSQFLCRLEHEGGRLIFDPSSGCRIMEAHNLRALVKQTLGDDAELSTEYLEGLNVRQSIVHLCNHIKHRRIEMGEYDQALLMVKRMRILMPDEYRLLLDAGVLYARTDNIKQARICLNDYIEKAPNHYDRRDAMLLLSELPD